MNDIHPKNGKSCNCQRQNGAMDCAKDRSGDAQGVPVNFSDHGHIFGSQAYKVQKYLIRNIVANLLFYIYSGIVRMNSPNFVGGPLPGSQGLADLTNLVYE